MNTSSPNISTAMLHNPPMTVPKYHKKADIQRKQAPTPKQVATTPSATPSIAGQDTHSSPYHTTILNSPTSPHHPSSPFTSTIAPPPPPSNIYNSSIYTINHSNTNSLNSSAIGNSATNSLSMSVFRRDTSQPNQRQLQTSSLSYRSYDSINSSSTSVRSIMPTTQTANSPVMLIENCIAMLKKYVRIQCDYDL